jgi:hypothetical protein
VGQSALVEQLVDDALGWQTDFTQLKPSAQEEELVHPTRHRPSAQTSPDGHSLLKVHTSEDERHAPATHSSPVKQSEAATHAHGP